jgi:hypothetical protein
MKAGIAAAVALLGLMASGTAMAGDGNQLLEFCKATLRTIDGEDKSNPTFGTGYCMGVVGTTMDVLYGIGKELPVNYRACPPAGGISYGQGIRIVTKYLEDNPKSLHYESSVLTMAALRNAYPCK